MQGEQGAVEAYTTKATQGKRNGSRRKTEEEREKREILIYGSLWFAYRKIEFP